MNGSIPSVNIPLFRRSILAAQSGSTLIEALVGTAVAAVGIVGLCVANAECLGITRSHREVLVADQCLQQRTEQFRNASWWQLTDPASACGLLNQSTANGAPLQDQAETVTISAYPQPTPAATALVVRRSGNDSATVVSQPPTGFSLRGSIALRIDFQESWTSAQGRRGRARAASTIIALGGLFN